MGFIKYQLINFCHSNGIVENITTIADLIQKRVKTYLDITFVM